MDLAFVLEDQFQNVIKNRQGDLTERVKSYSKIEKILKTTNNKQLRKQLKIKEMSILTSSPKKIVDQSAEYKISSDSKINPYKKVFRSSRGSLEHI